MTDAELYYSLLLTYDKVIIESLEFFYIILQLTKISFN